MPATKAADKKGEKAEVKKDGKGSFRLMFVLLLIEISNRILIGINYKLLKWSHLQMIFLVFNPFNMNLPDMNLLF